MKKNITKSANMYVMFGLLAVLFVSLGYLSMNSGREGLEDKKEEEKPATIASLITGPKPSTTAGTVALPVQGFRGGREGNTGMPATPVIPAPAMKKPGEKQGFRSR